MTDHHTIRAEWEIEAEEDYPFPNSKMSRRAWSEGSDLRDVQVQWDAEGETIERGRRSFIPERPAGEASMLAGVAAVLMIAALLPFIAAVLP